MFTQRCRQKYATKRINTLHKTPKSFASPTRAQRYGLGDKVESGYGFQFMKGQKALFNLKSLNELQALVTGMVQGKWLHLPKDMEINGDAVLNLERIVSEDMRKINKEFYSVTFDPINNFHAYSSIEQAYMDKFRGQSCMLERTTSRYEPSGAICIEDAIKTDRKAVVYAYALMFYLLQVGNWTDTGVMGNCEATIEYLISGYLSEEDPDTGEPTQVPINYGNWREKDFNVLLPSVNEEINFKKLAKDIDDWERADNDMRIVFRRALRETSLDQVEEWLNKRNHTAMLLRLVIDLVCHKFNLLDYVQDNEEDEMSLDGYSTFSFFWRADNVLNCIDEFANSSYQDGLGDIYYKRYFFSEGVFQLNPRKPHGLLMAAFTLMFDFDYNKYIYHDETYKKIRAIAPHVRVQQWRELLHRALTGIKWKSIQRVETDIGRVHQEDHYKLRH